MMMYGNSGIEDGFGIGDIISNNLIIRTKRDGIRGTFEHCIIEGNIILETNHENLGVTIGGSSYKRGGISLQNGAGITSCDGNKISNNKIIRSASSYTYEPDSSTKTSHNGGILIDSTYIDTIVTDNYLYKCEQDVYRDHGTTTINRTNDIVT
jgi:hypothetical protein